MLDVTTYTYLPPNMSFCHAEIPTLVFFTKIDTYDPDVIGQDLRKTFHSERLLTLVEVSSSVFDIFVLATVALCF